MDEDLHPIRTERFKWTMSGPLPPFSNTAPLADTGIELSILPLGRYWTVWEQGRRPAQKLDVYHDVFEIIASRLLSAFVAAVESWDIDKLLHSGSAIRAVYATIIGLRQM